MGNIYLAISDAFPGQFKIGRTSRDVEVRMDELSADDYGPSGFVGNADWSTHAFFEVEDEVAAEALLHEHFQADRLEATRELFSAGNAEDLTEEVFSLLSSEGLLHGFAELVDFGSTSTLIAGAAILAVTYAGTTIFVKHVPDDDLSVDIASWMDSKERAFNQWGEKQKKPLLHLPQRRVYRFAKFGLAVGKRLSDENLIEDERIQKIANAGREGIQKLERNLPNGLKRALGEARSLAKKKGGKLSQFIYDKEIPTEAQRLIEELKNSLKT